MRKVMTALFLEPLGREVPNLGSIAIYSKELNISDADKSFVARAWDSLLEKQYFSPVPSSA